MTSESTSSSGATSAAGDLPGSALPAVLFVSHEATRTGAPMFLLHFLRWLRRSTGLQFEILLGRGGPLAEAFRELAPVHTLDQLAEDSSWRDRFGLIYSNTICNAELFRRLDPGDLPVVTHVHELDMGYHYIGAGGIAEVMRHTSRFVACAEVVAARLRDVFGVPAERIAVHYEMIDQRAVVAGAGVDRAELRRRYGIPADAIVVSACGTFDSRKGPDLFLQMAVQLRRRIAGTRPVRFLWIGSLNSADLVKVIKGDVRKAGLQDEFILVGELPSPHGLIGLSDAFCLTSREDPFPLIMLEAALLGKPVICFEGSGGAAEFCAFGGGSAVPYLDAAAMAESVLATLNDSAEAGRSGARARDLVASRFSIEAVAPDLWRHLQGWLTEPDPGRRFTFDDASDAPVFATWNTALCPQSEYVTASLRRAGVRADVRQLVARGRREEATQRLVKLVAAEVAKKDPTTILDCLLDAADEFAAFDPERGRKLFEQAGSLFAKNPGLRTPDLRWRIARAARRLEFPELQPA